MHPKCLIVDEAGQCTEPDFLIPIVKFNVGKIVVVGDPLQLPPTVLSREAEKHGFKTSFVERFYKKLKKDSGVAASNLSNGSNDGNNLDRMILLNYQYRMHPEICHFPSNHIYDGHLVPHSSIGERPPFALTPYRVFNLLGTTEGRLPADGPNGYSCYNLDEANFVVNLVIETLSKSSSTFTMSSSDRTSLPASTFALESHTIGVITPYRGQMDVISKLLSSISITSNGRIIGSDGQIRGKVNWHDWKLVEDDDGNLNQRGDHLSPAGSVSDGGFGECDSDDGEEQPSPAESISDDEYYDCEGSDGDHEQSSPAESISDEEYYDCEEGNSDHEQEVKHEHEDDAGSVDKLLEEFGAFKMERLESNPRQKEFRRQSRPSRLTDLVDVRTIDSFQGDERDVIIFSCVRSSSYSSSSSSAIAAVGFVGDRNRMNVGLTRAKLALYVVGNMKTLKKDADWNAFYKDAARRNRVMSLNHRKLAESRKN